MFHPISPLSFLSFCSLTSPFYIRRKHMETWSQRVHELPETAPYLVPLYPLCLESIRNQPEGKIYRMETRGLGPLLYCSSPRFERTIEQKRKGGDSVLCNASIVFTKRNFLRADPIVKMIPLHLFESVSLSLINFTSLCLFLPGLRLWVENT